MNKEKKSLAFTLAEALLTLTIVGVLMTLMMRSVNRVSPDKEKILFLKTYHAVEHAIFNVMNDPSRYDQNYYSDLDIANICADDPTSCTNNRPKDLHVDFRDTPMKDAKVHIDGKELTSCDADKPSSPCLDKTNAMCYFLADSLNRVGDLDCSTTDKTKDNFKTSNGVCIRNIIGISDNASTPIIDPLCNGEGYAVKIFVDGKMTVPQTDDNVGTKQSKAFNWMQDQTQVK